MEEVFLSCHGSKICWPCEYTLTVGCLRTPRLLLITVPLRSPMYTIITTSGSVSSILIITNSIRKTLCAISPISCPQPFVPVKEGSCCDVIHLPFKFTSLDGSDEVKKSHNPVQNKSPGGNFPDSEPGLSYYRVQVWSWRIWDQRETTRSMIPHT